MDDLAGNPCTVASNAPEDEPEMPQRTDTLTERAERCNRSKASTARSSKNAASSPGGGRKRIRKQAARKEAQGIALPDSISVNSFAFLAEQGLTLDEILAQLLESSVDLSNYRDNITELMRIGRARGRGKLKMLQYDAAREGKTTAQQAMLGMLSDSGTASAQGCQADLSFERIVLPSSRA